MTLRDLDEYTALLHELEILKQDYAKTRSRLTKKRIDAVKAQIEKIDNFIGSAPNSRIRCALTLKYKQQRSWQYIAAHMGGRSGADAQRKMCSRWIENRNKAEKNGQQ